MFRCCVRLLVRLWLLGCASTAVGAAELVDPTRPDSDGIKVLAPSAAKPGVPRLQSVLIGPDRRLAVIGGRLLAEGQTAGGLRLLQVHPDRVRVELVDYGPLTLRLHKQTIRKESR